MPNFLNNRLLRALPFACAERLVALATYVDLPAGLPIFQRGEQPRYVYLLTGGIGSVVFISEAGASVELSTEGAEGMIGWSFLLGPMLNASTSNMQVAGAGFRVPLLTMQREFDSCHELRHRVLEFAQHQVVAVNQIAACNRLHRAEARFVRWLLMVSDRLGSTDISITQEFLSSMLGTRRTTVTEVCAELGRAGAIEGRRGGLRILDRGLLETRACECYGILRTRLNALYREPVRRANVPSEQARQTAGRETASSLKRPPSG